MKKLTLILTSFFLLIILTACSESTVSNSEGITPNFYENEDELTLLNGYWSDGDQYFSFDFPGDSCMHFIMGGTSVDGAYLEIGEDGFGFPTYTGTLEFTKLKIYSDKFETDIVTKVEANGEMTQVSSTSSTFNRITEDEFYEAFQQFQIEIEERE